ncbi:MAG TPA: dihydroorotate dehydrogenase [Thermodesulfobacteriota bacterium]|nr:dihydroorotate dehydrogenase [Thermodesulfobacteriota bacterium]
MIRERVDLSVDLGKLKLKNPVMPSSGTFGYGIEFADFLNLNELGAIVVKGTTLHPRLGNFQRRFTEIAGSAEISTIGLQNVGVERFIKEKLPLLTQFKTPVVVNIAGESVEEFVKITDALTQADGVGGIEVNLACPNVQGGGLQFSADRDATFQVVKAVRSATSLPIVAKLCPTITDVSILARVCEEAGADAICPIYAVMGMTIDVQTRRSKLGKNILASVGGPWMKPIALKLAWQAAQAARIPVVGGGGITCAEDAIEFFIAGATAVQVGIYNFVDPQIMVKIIEGVEKYLIEHRMKNIGDLRGSLSLS